MGPGELFEGADGSVVCPLRGEIDVQWCQGCPRRVEVSYVGDRAVVRCDPGPDPARGRSAGPLRDVPGPFRLY